MRLEDIAESTIIDKGWSSDIKFLIKDKSGKKYILRLSSIDKRNEKEKEYEIITLFSSLSFPTSTPVDSGITEDGKYFYMILNWVEGEDLEKVLPSLSEDEQYKKGKEAGHILSLIHSIPLKDEDIPTSTKKEKKLRQLKAYKESSVRIKGDDVVIEYLLDHIDDIWVEKPVYLHGDFHPGNLIYTNEGRIGVIDYNRWEVGDIYEEFYKGECFGVESSVPFVRGMIDSYYNYSVPDSFWRAFAFYSLHAALFSIKWAEKFGEEEVESMKKRGTRIISDFKDLSSCVPSWYK